jgi:hypothetical protein
MEPPPTNPVEEPQPKYGTAEALCKWLGTVECNLSEEDESDGQTESLYWQATARACCSEP